jgi:aminopeptidase N
VRSRRALSAAVVVLVSTVALAPVAQAAPVRGSAGIGDPYFPLDGNGGIDVLHYRIHDAYRFGDMRLRGRTRLTVRTTEDLKSFDLDFLLPVHRVSIDGKSAGYDQATDSHELVIHPVEPVRAGETLEVVVAYAGFPDRFGYRGERNWLADAHEVVAMNQPHMAPWWFPANDHPRDKALVDISITVPRGRQVIANGRRVAHHVHGDQATYHWRADEPMAPYLAFFAAGRFSVSQGVRDGLPWLVAVSHALSASQRRTSMRLMEKTPNLVAWLESQLGDYPFSRTGGLTTSLNPGFALENQTRPTYPVLGGDGTGIVVHELAHQWFGDSVAIQSWRDIWLNEGSATFMEVRYDETHGGENAHDWLERLWSSFGADDPFWHLVVSDPGPDSIFDWPVYERGAMTLQALRQRVGDVAFWTIIRTWLADRAGGNGSTQEFTALAEHVSGQDLDGFFQAWLVAPTRPEHTADNGLG